MPGSTVLLAQASSSNPKEQAEARADILRALRKHQGNTTHAAAELGVSRPVLLKAIRRIEGLGEEIRATWPDGRRDGQVERWSEEKSARRKA